MMNSCNFTGRLVDNPRLFEGEANRVTFSLAVDRDFVPEDGGKSVDYLDFVAWRETANYIMRHFRKGDLMQVVNSRARIKTFTGKDGEEKRKTEYEVGKVYCLLRKRREDTDE